MYETGEIYMTISHSYVAELELLITDTLLPIFDKYYRDRGELPSFTGINPELLKQLKKRKVLPALLLPKKN